MPTERIAMRRVREMLRLSRDAGLATREVARRTGVAPSTLREMFRRFERSGLAWPLPLDLADAGLETLLYGEAGTKQGRRRRVEPDWAALNRELKRKHVTLQILWDEYIETTRTAIATAGSATSTVPGKGACR
jgi:transposase-like protein